jgi:hypothetical protein
MSLKYLLAGFPLIGPNSVQDWVPVDGSWHNAVMIREGDRSDFYIDGQLVGARWDHAISREELEMYYVAHVPEARRG